MKKILAAVLSTLLLAGCVSVDPKTGRALPRGNQTYMFDHVQQRAQHLQDGMPRIEILLLLGSPAKMLTDDTVWCYYPERAAVLVPAKWLRLEFRNDALVEYGYRPVFLGVHF